MKPIEIAVTIPSCSAKDYPILVGADLTAVSTWLPKQLFNQIVIITDNRVKKYYGLSLHHHLKQAGYASLLLSFPAGEKYKNNKTKQALENAMLAHRCDRDTLVIALGGGVVGDLAGFIAATYFRGVPFIQIPTTLLAMVDSSVGGKTGINTIHGKNLIGAIYQPIGVVVDVNCLKTLPKKHRINGLVEAIKMFLTYDAASFYYIESHLPQIMDGDAALLKEIIIRSLRIKAGVVARDEKEHGERKILNFGHTIGHALEQISHYRLLHGYAVAYGILVEATISHLLGFLEKSAWLEIITLMGRLGFYSKDLQHYDLTQLIEATKMDKKNRLGNVRYTLLRSIGLTYVTKGDYVHPVADDIVRDAFHNHSAFF